MSSEKKKGKAKERESFFWHLRAPYNVEGSELYFDRYHWWKNDSTMECAESATYELLRRHPSVEEIHRTQQPYKDKNTDCLQGFLQCSGLKSWPALLDSEKQWFFDVLRERYPSKGRDLTPRVVSITSQSVDLTQGINPRAALAILPKLSDEDRQTAEEARLDEIRRLAGEHHQAGRILIAISPNFGAYKDAFDLLKKCFLQHRQKPPIIGRGRPENWLPIIARFEEGEDELTATTIRNADLFRRYRKLFEHVRI